MCVVCCLALITVIRVEFALCFHRGEASGRVVCVEVIVTIQQVKIWLLFSNIVVASSYPILFTMAHCQFTLYYSLDPVLPAFVRLAPRGKSLTNLVQETGG